jgi:epoxyqueuosine reductase QueG
VVFFVPFSENLSDGNIEGKFPGVNWGLSLSLTNDLIQRTSEYVRRLLDQCGYRSALTPATYNFDPDSLTARWSHKHLAHLCGLGRFGVNAQIITPAGCAGRLGSLVTEARLGNHPLVVEKELCLQKLGHDCLECLQTCPMKAISLNGIDRHRCNQRLQINRKRFARKPDMRNDIEVCAKCVSGMPCDLHAPASAHKRDGAAVLPPADGSSQNS